MGGTIALSCDEPLLFSRPSIDVLFESAADVYGETLIAAILTGANHDGSAGLRIVQEKGGVALVQSVASAYAKAMPQAALEKCPDARNLSPEAIADFLRRECGND